MGALLPLIAKGSNVADGIGLVPSSALGKSVEPVRRPLRPLAEDHRVVGDRDIEPVARGDAEASPRLARDDDLVLGADFDT